MADNIEVTAGTGTLLSTDEETGGAHIQRVRSTAELIRVAQTPTISTTAYAAKDAVGGLMTFANCTRHAGGSCWIEAVQVEDKAQQMKSLDLVLFDQTITAPTDNAIFAPTDAELAWCVGIISITNSDYRDFSTNSVAVRQALGLPVTLVGTSLFGVLVARETPTYAATTDIVVTLAVVRD